MVRTFAQAVKPLCFLINVIDFVLFGFFQCIYRETKAYMCVSVIVSLKLNLENEHTIVIFFFQKIYVVFGFRGLIF